MVGREVTRPVDAVVGGAGFDAQDCGCSEGGVPHEMVPVSLADMVPEHHTWDSMHERAACAARGILFQVCEADGAHNVFERAPDL